MSIEHASAGTQSTDETLPLVIRIFVYTDEAGSHEAAAAVRRGAEELIPEIDVQIYEDVMPDEGRSSSLADLWAEANPGVDPGERKRWRISVFAPGLSYAELADLSGPLADYVSPGWSEGAAAEQARTTGQVPPRVAVGRADEHPGEPPLKQK